MTVDTGPDWQGMLGERATVDAGPDLQGTPVGRMKVDITLEHAREKDTGGNYDGRHLLHGRKLPYGGQPFWMNLIFGHIAPSTYQYYFKDYIQLYL